MATKKKTFIAERRKWGRRKSDYVIRYMLIVSLLANIALALFVASCQMAPEYLDIATPTTRINTGPVINGWKRPPGSATSPSILQHFAIAPAATKYTGSATVVYYDPANPGTDAGSVKVKVNDAGKLEYDRSVLIPPPGTYSFKSITLTESSLGPKQPVYLIGRESDDSTGFPEVTLALDANGILSLRDLASAGGVTPIGTYAEFQLINTNLSGMGQEYKQEADLDLMNEEWEPIGNSAQEFTGTYDGGGHTVSNLKINNPGATDPVGLFGSVNRWGVIKNLGIASGTVSGGDDVGGIAGYNGGTITACYNRATVSGGGNVGSIAGTSDNIITACYNAGVVSGTGNMGGIAGISTGNITACYNSGAFTGGGTVGGIVGDNSGGVTFCYWNGSGMKATGRGTGPSRGDSGSSFYLFFGPTGYEWGTASKDNSANDAGTSGHYWKYGIDYTTTLPRLWFE